MYDYKLYVSPLLLIQLVLHLLMQIFKPEQKVLTLTQQPSVVSDNRQTRKCLTLTVSVLLNLQQPFVVSDDGNCLTLIVSVILNLQKPSWLYLTIDRQGSV